jgi:hypothetical protein
LPPETPTPEVTAGGSTEVVPAENKAEKRTIVQAFRDLLDSVQKFKDARKDVSGAVALLIALIPVLLIALAITFFAYRLYLLERRRRRTLDRLFEMELAELAALEGKMDLLSEKGTKGKELYKEEFQKAKDNILRQLRPSYGKPLEKPASSGPDVPPPA